MTAHAFRVVEPRLGLYGSPDTISIACPRACRNRGYDVSVHCAREVDNTLPLGTRKNAVEALWWCLEWRAVIVLKIGTVPPRAAYANERRSKRRGESAKFGVRKINRRTILKPAGIETRGLVAGARVWRRGSAFVRQRLVGWPKPAAGDFAGL